jgi:beta-lactamase regulating signal transducer with metallopeptidase domain
MSVSAMLATTRHTHSRLVMTAAGRFTIRETTLSLRAGSPSHSVQRCPAIALAISVTHRLTADTPAASITVSGNAEDGIASDEIEVPTTIVWFVGTMVCLFCFVSEVLRCFLLTPVS